MNTSIRSLAFATFAMTTLGTAALADPYLPAAKTLEQSRAEYIAARQNGDLPMGFAALTQRQIFQGNAVDAGNAPAHPFAAAQPGTTPLGFVAKTERDLFPGNFAAQTSTLTRAQVRAEMVAAQKAGELPIGFVARSPHDLFPARTPRNGATDNVAAVPGTTAR